MNYRQWKKNYKKKYGENPPVNVDKRKQRKIAKRAVMAISKIDITEMAMRVSRTISDAFASIYEALGNVFAGAAIACKNCAGQLRDNKEL